MNKESNPNEFFKNLYKGDQLEPKKPFTGLKVKGQRVEVGICDCCGDDDDCCGKN